MSKVIVNVSELCKSYNGKIVVDKINLQINKGEVFGILGPNGAGKTTAIEMIEGVRSIDKGQVVIDNLDVKNKTNQVRQIIGVQPQSPAFQDKTKLKEVLDLFASTYGVKVDSLELLSKVGLSDKANSYTETLSGGQLQRLSIIASLVHQPKVLFMDEPTTGLDPQARLKVWELVESIKASGITVVLTTHYMEEAEQLCSRVAIMDKGKIIALDTPDNLINQLLDRGFKNKKLVRQASLEDVFIDLTGKALRD